MRFTLLFTLIILVATPAGAVPVYVGLFQVSDGPRWQDNPQVLSAREAAALIYGGEYTDYAISTDPDRINNMAWLDGWADTTYLTTPAHEDFSLGYHYQDALKTGSTFSAFVRDHAGASEGRYNYVWRLGGAAAESPVVPEPMTILMLGGGSLGIVMLRRRRARSAARREFANLPDA